MSGRSSAVRTGEAAFNKIEKVNAELLTLTYGAMVSQVVRDYEDADDINKQLEKMGYNIGIRLVDEFLAKSGVQRCASFVQTADVIAKVAFKMFLGVTCDVANWNEARTRFSLLIRENPLTDFVELPPNLKDVFFANILVGVIRGSLEMIQLEVECHFKRCVLRGDDVSEIVVELKSVMEEEYPGDDDE